MRARRKFRVVPSAKLTTHRPSLTEKSTSDCPRTSEAGSASSASSAKSAYNVSSALFNHLQRWYPDKIKNVG